MFYKVEEEVFCEADYLVSVILEKYFLIKYVAQTETGKHIKMYRQNVWNFGYLWLKTWLSPALSLYLLSYLAKLNFSSSFQTENNMEGKPSREE